MRRLVLILLVVLLPLQFAWAGAAAYCQHESGTSASHFGHHEHVHHGQAKKSGEKTLLGDPDCAVCHVVTAPSAIAAPAVLHVPAAWAYAYPATLPAFSSARATVPERPNWTRPA